MNLFICPNPECIQNAEPVYLDYPCVDVECGSCQTHGATVEVAENE